MNCHGVITRLAYPLFNIEGIKEDQRSSERQNNTASILCTSLGEDAWMDVEETFDEILLAVRELCSEECTCGSSSWFVVHHEIHTDYTEPYITRFAFPVDKVLGIYETNEGNNANLDFGDESLMTVEESFMEVMMLVGSEYVEKF